MNRTLIMIVASFMLLSYNCNRRDIEIEDLYITDKDITLQFVFNKIISDSATDITICALSLIQKALREQVAKNNGIIINDSMLQLEASRFDKETKAPEILQKIKDIFKDDKTKYLKYYVKSVLIERLLQERFFYDTLYHIALYHRIKNVFKTIDQDLMRKDTVIKIFEPEKDFKQFYEKDLNKGICEDKYTYHFVVHKNRKLLVYQILKNDYTKWFQEQALKLRVKINDKTLKNKLIERTKSSKYWQEILSSNPRR